MLELKDIVMKYGERVIYDHADFKAYENELTIVMGKSGSGKSTLHHIITLYDNCECDYFYNDIDINNLSDKEKNEFIQNHFGIVNQFPAFINDLTVKQHIELCQSLNTGYDVKEYINDLCLEETLDKYPMQLSGGEKMRIAVLLALVHQPDILVFDEPTSSLDRHHSQIIVDMMKKYAHNGHISIIFTHDSLMKEVADRLYYIEDKQLTMTSFVHEDSVIKEKHEQVQKKSYFYFLRKMFRYKTFYKSATLFITGLMIALATFTIVYGNSTIQYYVDKMNNTNKVGVMYKESVDETDFFPFSNQEYTQISKIKGINKIWPLITTPNAASGFQLSGYDNYFKIYNNNELIQEVMYPMNHENGTYNTDYKYNEKMVREFDNDRGIYIDGIFLFNLFYPEIRIYTDEVYEQIYDFIESLDENIEIEIPLSIPVYSARDEGLYGCVFYKQTRVKKKIKGIFLNDEEKFAFGGKKVNKCNFFYPLDEMLKLIEENKPTQEEFEVHKPYYEKQYKMHFDYFKPYYYQFTVDNNTSFQEVKTQIELQGVRVDSIYADAERDVEIITQLNSGMKMITIIISLITLFILFGIKYNQRNEYRDYMKFYMDRGYSFGFASRQLIMKFTFHAVICMLVSFVLFAVMIVLVNEYYYSALRGINFLFIVFIVGLSLSVEVVLPMFVVNGGKSYDKIK